MNRTVTPTGEVIDISDRMPGPGTILLVLDLAGVFAFALNGALAAVRARYVDIVGVVALALTTALGGGILRDVVIGRVPPATFEDWRYLAVAASGGLVAFAFARALARVQGAIEVADAAGLGLFAVTGTGVALTAGLGPVQSVILGVVTAVGGGTLRDVLLGRVPTVLHSGLYAVPAALAAVLAWLGGVLAPGAVTPLVAAAAACVALRLVSVRFDLHAPRPPAP